MTMKQMKTAGLTLLLLLGSLILAACSGANNPRPSTDSLTTAQLTAPQTISTDEWDAAAFYATTCASCHGPTGGGSAVAPALNREAIQTAETEWLIETISNGRPGTAMPAWSVEFGGRLKSDQIARMAAFLQAGDWDEDGEIAADQPFPPMGMGMMGRGMGSGMMGNGMGGGRQP